MDLAEHVDRLPLIQRAEGNRLDAHLAKHAEDLLELRHRGRDRKAMLFEDRAVIEEANDFSLGRHAPQRALAHLGAVLREHVAGQQAFRQDFGPAVLLRIVVQGHEASCSDQGTHHIGLVDLGDIRSLPALERARQRLAKVFGLEDLELHLSTVVGFREAGGKRLGNARAHRIIPSGPEHEPFRGNVVLGSDRMRGD